MPDYTVEHARAGIRAKLPRLETWPNQFPGYQITTRYPEYTSVCPKTGLPDYGALTIQYQPRKLCLELKSLKMYMWSFRNEGAFHEKVTNDILGKIVEVTRPRYARITAKWYVRGGIYTNVVAEHRKKGWKPQPVVMLPAHGAESGLHG
jgi:7-cyano-7-deazaguanine reductase